MIVPPHHFLSPEGRGLKVRGRSEKGVRRMSFGDEMKNIGEGISASYDARIGTLEDIFKDTQSTLKNARSMVKDFHTEHQHMSEEQRKNLDHFKKELMNDTRSLINDFRKQFNEMANAMRNELDRFHHTIYQETHNLLKTYHGQMNTVRNEFQKGHQAWSNFSRSMQQQKGMKQPPRKMQNRQEQVCSILQGHPKGMTMGQISKEMGCSSQSLRSTFNNMKQGGMISKRQNKYYCRG